MHNDCIYLLPNEVKMTATEKAKYYVDFGNALSQASKNGDKITAFKSDGAYNDTELSLFANSGLADKGFGFVSMVDSSGQKQHFVNGNTVKNLSNTNESVTHNGTNKVIDGKNYALLTDTSKLLIDGITYTAGTIAEAGEIAYDALSDFVQGNYKNNIISNALSHAVNNTFADLAGIIANGGTFDTTKILQTFAKRTGYAFIASSITQTTAARELTVYLNGGKVETIKNITYIKTKSGGNITADAKQKLDSNKNVYYEGKNSSGQTVTATEADMSLGGTGGAGVKALPLWGQGWVGDEVMTTPSNDNRPMQSLQIVA